MAAKGSETERESYIGARVTDDKRRTVRVRAAQLDKSISEYIRDLVNEDLESSQSGAN